MQLFYRYYVYEVQSQNIFPLSPKDGSRDAPLLQHVLWAPITTIKPNQNLPGTYLSNAKSGSQAIAFVYENDLYYKPKVQTDLVCRITTTGNFHYLSLDFHFIQQIFQEMMESSTMVYRIGCIRILRSSEAKP